MAFDWRRGCKLALGAALLAGGVRFGTPYFARNASAAPIVEAAMREQVRKANRETLEPLEEPHDLGERGRARAQLGARLFSEPRLSGDGSLSCAGCHQAAGGGADGRKVAVGLHGRTGAVNTPTVWNVDLNDQQYWDGRAESLEAQIEGALENPMEMDSTWAAVVSTLTGDASYRAAFSNAYPNESISASSVRDAIATYERSLVATSSRFDRYLRGDREALSASEVSGYQAFRSYGCIRCHQGRNVGGNLFAKMGVMADYFAARGGAILPSDYGRFNVTRREEDRFKFRVPSLRMVAYTAPYFHDGSAVTLADAVTRMGRFELGEELPPTDVSSIVAFLTSLAPDPGALQSISAPAR